MTCPNCQIDEARVDPIYGVIPCSACASLPHARPHQQIEFTSTSIKEQRKEFRTDVLPAHRKGELDKGFVDRYGAKKAKQQGFSDREIAKAKYVWDSDTTYYKSV